MTALATLSTTLGWLYTLSWSSSFYPQTILNYKRRSVNGLSIDFLYLNVLGFSCYSVFNLASLLSERIRAEYRERHDGKDSLVRWNDVAFAVHATFIASFTVFQSLIYKRERTQTVSLPTLLFLALSGISILVGIILVIQTHETRLSWLDLIYFLSYVKVGVSAVKYLPQAWLNYQRKSTEGWSIDNILLDLTGGVLSLAQLVLDAYAVNDWSALQNPAKLGLSLLSITFDLLFITQHYFLYPHSNSGSFLTGRSSRNTHTNEQEEEEEGEGERRGLLA